MDDQVVRAAAQAWVTQDPDPIGAQQVRAWLDADDTAALREAFGGSMAFGTGGMRGPMGPGTRCMNRLTIRRAAAAWVDALVASGADVASKGIAVSYDGRHHSKVYAEDVARIAAGRGARVYLAPVLTPTPVLSFATAHLGCVGGAIVTASHNPPADNGFKVFDGQGAQILSPFDEDVADRMAAMDDPGVLAALGDARIVPWPDAVRQAYLAGIGSLRVRRPGASLRIAYTPMHGVGRDWTPVALAAAGHDDLHPVPSQIDPDGDFPTVAFPNPEEAGALDRLVAHAEAVGATLALANDPDADRLAVVVLHAGAWVTLSGNEVGALLTEDLLAAGSGSDRMVGTTIVSTALAGAVCAHHGVACVETLTGFKFIADKARRHEAAGGTFVLGFEESIGYTVGSRVLDKDGVSAAVIVADLAAALAAEGRTLVDALEALFARHGRHVAETRSLRMPGEDGRARIASAMASLRADPPSRLGPLAVGAVWDVQAGVAIAADGTRTALDLPSSDVMGFFFADGGRAWVRPSGTEPKIKFYVEVVVDGDRAMGQARLDAVHAALRVAAGGEA